MGGNPFSEFIVHDVWPVSSVMAGVPKSRQKDSKCKFRLKMIKQRALFLKYSAQGRCPRLDSVMVLSGANQAGTKNTGEWQTWDCRHLKVCL